MKYAELGTIADVNWGDTSVTKASYVEQGYPAYSATGKDGFLPYFDFERDGIVLSAIGARCGKTWFATGRWSVIKNTIRFWSESKELDNRYLYWLTADPEFWPKRGAAQPFITIGDARKLRIPLPPLDEQKNIAAVLDQADSMRHQRQRALDRINHLGQAIFNEMFGDFTTNSLGWNSVKLGDICDVGSSKRVFVEEFVERGVPFYRGTEVGKLAAGETVIPDLFISSDHYAKLVHHSGKPAVGDLLLPSICHDGRIWRVENDEPFYFKDGRVLWIKRNDAAIDSEYLRNYLRNAFLRNYHSIASGTTFAELKIVNLKGLSIFSPPMELQREFSMRIRAVEALRNRVVQALSACSSLFTSLQARAFRGEL
jgi:type I restriction enzyme S subunit